jgi:hypothetical protein
MRFVSDSNGFSVASHQGGPFLWQLFSLFKMISQKSIASSPVLSLHATHDTTIKPILNFFGLVCRRSPLCLELQLQTQTDCNSYSTFFPTNFFEIVCFTLPISRAVVCIPELQQL